LSLVKAGEIQVTGSIHASDLNAPLIYMYRNIQTRVDDIISELRTLSSAFNEIKVRNVVGRKARDKIVVAETREDALESQEAYYYWVRAKYNALCASGTATENSDVAVSAMLIFLNKTCFRGVYRENAERQFNVPFGNYAACSIFSDHHLREMSRLIQDVHFHVRDCSVSLELVKLAEHSDDFVYLDPPYMPTDGKKGFVDYTTGKFDGRQHAALFEKIRGLNGARMLLSNSDSPIVQSYFPQEGGYQTHVLAQCKRAIHSINPSATASEVLITNVQNDDTVGYHWSSI
jgi:DNA adenine methylase